MADTNAKTLEERIAYLNAIDALLERKYAATNDEYQRYLIEQEHADIQAELYEIECQQQEADE